VLTELCASDEESQGNWTTLVVLVVTTLTCGDITGNAGTQNRIIGTCGRKPGSLIRAIGTRSEGIKELEFAR